MTAEIRVKQRMASCGRRTSYSSSLPASSASHSPARPVERDPSPAAIADGDAGNQDAADAVEAGKLIVDELS